MKVCSTAIAGPQWVKVMSGWGLLRGGSYAQHGRHGTARHGTARHGTAR
jgi:hypothetical protein